MKITFRGAAQTVTGSMHELESGGRRMLLDCGLFQGRRAEANERNRNFPWPGESVDAVLLSHAHIDHSGNLPNLYKNGFRGPIFTSPATLDLCTAMLQDSAFLQEKDALFFNKRMARRRRIDVNEIGGDEVQPLYSVEDAKATLTLFRPIPLHTPTQVAPDITYTTFEAGHMLGSTAMMLDVGATKLIFSGDVGRKGLPIINDPEAMPVADYLIMESTYGDRLHKDSGNVKDKLADIISRTAARGGRIIVPAFAVGRAQQLVVLIHELVQQKLIPSIPIFVDSPLTVNVTEVFRKHDECYDSEIREAFKQEDPFGFGRLRYIRDVQESKALNDLHGPYLVISASGMCEGGRVLHHLRNGISDSRNTVLMTGYAAVNTLGRKIIDGDKEVNIFGEPHRVRAEVQKIDELSGHADQSELLQWMKPIVTKRLKRIFLVHGEPQPQAELARMIEKTYQIPVEIPGRGDAFDL